MEDFLSANKKVLILTGFSIFLVITFINNYLLSSNIKINLCADSSYINIHVRLNYNIDIVVGPKNIKNILNCLGKSMPFYDRTIEYVIGDISVKDNLELGKRYKIKKIQSKGQLIIDKVVIIKSRNVVEINHTTEIIVIQNSLIGPFSAELESISEESTVLLPKPSYSLENIWNRRFRRAQMLKDGDFKQY